MASVAGQGRLRDPDMCLETDPRTHRGLLEALRAHGMAGPPTFIADITPESPLDAICAFTRQVEGFIEDHYSSLSYHVPDPARQGPIAQTEEWIPTPNDSKLRIIVYRPPAPLGASLPAVVYFHGGAMIMLKTEGAMHTAWATALAETGLVVIAVDFRNTLTSTGLEHPFPAGLDDCATAVRWIDAHRDELEINKVVLQGESGGANLALATTLRAKREGWLDAIDGVCATVPYISGAYNMPTDWKLQELPSLVECDRYLMSCANSTLNALIYDPSGANARNPLAWPYWATEDDLRGLPPHLIVTSELDLLRDEGNAYYRKLVQAGVRAVGRVNLGLTHQGEINFPQAVPDVFLANLWELKAFVDRLPQRGALQPVVSREAKSEGQKSLVQAQGA